MKKTVLVLGAGASADLGFPIGDELLRLILHKLCPQENDTEDEKSRREERQYLSDLVNQIVGREKDNIPPQNKHHLKEIGDRRQRLEHLKKLRARIWKDFEDSEWYKVRGDRPDRDDSIDHYLINFRSFWSEEESEARRLIAKYAIAYILQGREHAANERIKDKDIWLSAFLKNAQHVWVEIAQNLDIITFNYDRTVEQMIHQFVQEKYRDGEALPSGDFAGKSFIEKHIHHVYGSLGKFIPRDENPLEGHVRFGENHDQPPLHVQSAKSINLIRERTTTTPTYRHLFQSADQIFFLGFGFAADNMEILGWEEFMKDPTFSEKRILATGKIQVWDKFRVPTTDIFCKEFSEKHLSFELRRHPI